MECEVFLTLKKNLNREGRGRVLNARGFFGEIIELMSEGGRGE